MPRNVERALWIALPLLVVGALVALPRALAFHHRVDSVAELHEHLEDGLAHLMRKVDASDAQEALADAIAKQRAPALFAVLTEGRAVRAQLKAALLADQLDPVAVTAAQGRLDALTKRASDIVVSTLTEVAQVLTPAQRKALAERLARFER